MADITPISATDMPEGEYAIVEALGHRTLIGRTSEVERFGTKMLQVEPLFGEEPVDPDLLIVREAYAQWQEARGEDDLAARHRNGDWDADLLSGPTIVADRLAREQGAK